MQARGDRWASPKPKGQRLDPHATSGWDGSVVRCERWCCSRSGGLEQEPILSPLFYPLILGTSNPSPVQGQPQVSPRVGVSSFAAYPHVSQCLALYLGFSRFFPPLNLGFAQVAWLRILKIPKELKEKLGPWSDHTSRLRSLRLPQQSGC